MLPITRLSIREGARRKLIYLFLGITGVLIFFLLNAGGVEYDDQRVTEANLLAYVGHWMCLVFTSLLAVFVSMNAIGGEVDRQSIHLVLVRPVTRFRFWLERWLGACVLGWLSMIIMLAALAVSLAIKCGPEAFQYALPGFIVLPFSVACVSALVVALNSRLPSAAAGLIGTVMVLLGFYHSQLSLLTWAREGPFDECARFVLAAIPPLSDIVPQISKMTPGHFLILDPWQLGHWLVYTWAWIALGLLCFGRREV